MSENAVQAAEASAAAIASKATYAGGATSLAGLITQTDWLGLLGVGIAFTGLVISFYFSYQRNKREQAEDERKQELHRLQMAKLNGECNVKD